MKRFPHLSTLLSATVIFTSCTIGAAQNTALEDLLRTPTPTAQVVPDRMRTQWGALVRALGDSNMPHALATAKTLRDTRDFLEPVQRSYVTLVIELLDPSARGAGTDAVSNAANDLARRVATLEAEVATAVDATQRARLQFELNTLKNKLTTYRGAEGTGLRDRVYGSVKDLETYADYSAAIGLINAYQSAFGADAGLNTLAQSMQDGQRKTGDAMVIAETALGPVKTALQANRLWTAKAELDRVDSLLKIKVTDPVQLIVINRELAYTRGQLELALKKADDQVMFMMQLATQDMTKAKAELTKFLAMYSDYPETTQLTYKLDRASYMLKLDTIRKIAANDPSQARTMLRDFQKDLSKEDAGLLSSEIAKIYQAIFAPELAAIQKDIDDAQAFFTRATKMEQEVIEINGQPATRKINTSSEGTENLIRARSLQAGAYKRLEALLKEEVDPVTRAKATGLLETSLQAVNQIDGKLGNVGPNGLTADPPLATSSIFAKIPWWIWVGGAAVVVALLIGVAFIGLIIKMIRGRRRP